MSMKTLWIIRPLMLGAIAAFVLGVAALELASRTGIVGLEAKVG